MATSLDKITAIATQRFEEMLGNMTIEPLLHQTAIDIGLRIQEALTQDNGQGTANALPPEQMALLNRTHARILEAVARAPGLSPEATQGLNALDAALCDALIRDEESHLKQEGITPENVSWWNILKTHGWREVWSAAATKGNSLYEGLRDNRVNPRLKDIASRIVNLSDIDLLPPNDGRIVLRALAKTAPNLILFDIEDRNGVEGLRSWLNDPNPTTTEVRNRLTTLLGAEALTKLTSDMQALLAYLQSQTDPVACLDPLFTAVQQTTQQTNPDTLLATIEPLYEGISNRFKVRIERAREAVELLTQISTVENDRIKLFKNRQQQEQEQTKLNTELGTISVNQKAQRAQCQRQIEAITQQITTTDQHLEEKTREAKKLRKRYLTLRTKTQGQSAPDAALFIDLPKEPPRFTQRTNTNRIINLLDTAILDLETQANEWETKRNGRLDDDSDPGQAARNHGLHFKTFRELESTYTTLEQASNEQRLRERKIPGAPLAAPTTHPLPTRTPLLCLRELIRNDQTINRGVPADNQDLHVDLITLLMVDLTKNSEVTYPEQTKRLARARLKKLGLITEKQEKSIDYVSFPKFMQQLSQQDENFRALATLPPDASIQQINAKIGETDSDRTISLATLGNLIQTLDHYLSGTSPTTQGGKTVMLNLDIDILELRNRLRAVQCARLIRQTKKAPNGTPPPDINTVLSTVLEELSSDAAEIPELEGDQTANQRQIAEKKAEAAREKEAAREAARASAEAARQATNNSTSNGSNLARTGLAEGAAQGFFSELMRRFLDYLEKSRRRNLPPGPPTS